MTAPRPSLPTTLPAPPRTPAAKARLLDVGGGYPARHGLSAGGEWIRTSSSARDRQRLRGFGRVGADRPSARRYHPRSRRPRQIDRAVAAYRGVIVHRRMKAPTLLAVARHRGTDSSNPFPSSGESAAKPRERSQPGRGRIRFATRRIRRKHCSKSRTGAHRRQPPSPCHAVFLTING